MTPFIMNSAILACLLTTSSTIEAFAPALRSKSAFVPSYSVLPSTVRSSTSLNMNLFDRFSRVAKSNLNNILKNLEDPEKIMNQAVEDMQVGPPFGLLHIFIYFYLFLLTIIVTWISERFGENSSVVCGSYGHPTAPNEAKGASRFFGK